MKYPSWPKFTRADIKAAKQVLKSGKTNLHGGKYCASFERVFSNYCGAKYGVTLNSGTSALHAALMAKGIGPRDEVIVPCFTFATTATAVLLCGATPVFCDVNLFDANIDVVEDLKRVITEKTKAVIPVHIYGNAMLSEMDELLHITKDRGIHIIEDASQAHGAYYSNNTRSGKEKKYKVGGYRSIESYEGNMSVFSFCQDKIITTGGEGGMVLTNNEDEANFIRSFRDMGNSPASRFNDGTTVRYNYDTLGYNYRMTEMQAAVGLSMFRRIEDLLRQRRENATFLSSILGRTVGGWIKYPVQSEIYNSSMYRYVIRLRGSSSENISAFEFVIKLRENGLSFASTAQWPEIYKNKVFEGTIGLSTRMFPNASELGRTLIVLKMHPTLKEKHIKDYARIIKKTVMYFAGRT